MAQAASLDHENRRHDHEIEEVDDIVEPSAVDMG